MSAMLPKVALIQSPTPLHRLDYVSQDLGVDLWIKRDDLTGFAFGGNKGRKLEYLMADVLNKGATVVTTCGAAQSNFIRQLGAACARHGVRCFASVMRSPYEDEPPKGSPLPAKGGNVTLDEILGVELWHYPDANWETLFSHWEEVSQELSASGERVYRIPVGGSSPLGAYAFTQAALELESQGQDFDWIVFASSSGSTHVGLQFALRGSKTKVYGFACDPEPEIAHDFAELSEGLAKLLGSERPLKANDFLLDFSFVGDGYGIPSAEGESAIRYLARREGVFLDPIYSGKAFAGLKARIGEGRISGRVLFWHTGGLPALLA